ncbi:hypothetical protein M3Y95_00884300 [Aphelenchoides besseyi]|nr:hypothetical protein M3Y95_00884300 [Aphelenchoides besseyi]
MDHYNPKNPFVANEYFFVNVNNHPFAESTFAVVHRVNNLVSGLVATIASLLLLYCALYRSPWNFRYYSKMIILGVFIDMCQTMSNLWCQVMAYHKKKNYAQ